MNTEKHICSDCSYRFSIAFNPANWGRILLCPNCQSRNVLWEKPTMPSQKKTKRRPCCG